MILLRWKWALTAVLVMTALAGCSLIKNSSATARMTVEYATLKVIDGDDAKRERVIEIATGALDRLDSTPQETIPALVSAISDEVNWQSLDAADTVLVRSLLAELEQRLIDKYGDVEMGGDARLAAKTVARWVIESASR